MATLRELRNFLKEVDVIETQILNGNGEPEGAPTKPVGDGETVIGVVDDSWLKALFLARRKHLAALEEESLELQKLGILGFFEHMDRIAAFAGKIAGADALSDLVWEELGSSLEAPTGDLGLRQGWKLVTPAKTEESVAVPRPDPQPTMRIHVGEFPRSTAPKHLDCDGCPDLECPEHPAPKAQA